LRKGYGTLLAAFVAFSVLLGPRPETSASRAGQNASHKADSNQATVEHFANENFTTCKTDGETDPPCKDCSPLCPAKDLLDLIQAHFGEPEASSQKNRNGAKPKKYQVDEHWGVPEGENTRILFVIATVPDPVRTHLSLSFDRSLEAVTKAAQQAGFLFSRATMPWENGEHPDTPDVKMRIAGQVYQDHKEDFPGLMIFRDAHGADDLTAVGDPILKPHAAAAKTLFVLVVGETPTGGIRKEQFKNALRMIKGIRGKDTIPEELRALRILGTTSSGSLASLEQILQQELGGESRTEFGTILIHSGTASSWTSTEEFREFLKIWDSNAEFSTFQESDQYADEHFRCYLEKQGYEARDIAILSEDETAYGNIQSSDAEAAGPCRDYGGELAPEDHQMVRLYFPRDIAQLRAAYQRDLTSQDGAENGKKAPRTTLPLNLDTTGSDGDSVSPYANLQTPLSQEAVLLGVVSNLRKHHIRFIIIRASNSLDTFFLCQFLRNSYPDAHIATIGSDLLYQRDVDRPNLHGVMSITTYPLLPGIDDEVARVAASKNASHEDKVFSDNYSAGVFNALLSLVAEGSSAVPAEAQKKEAAAFPKQRQAIFPQASYAQFGWPVLSQHESKDAAMTPPLWLTLNGNGGAWPLALLDEDEKTNAILKPGSNLDAVQGHANSEAAHASAPLEWQITALMTLGLAALFSWLMAWPPSFPRSEALTTFRLDEDDYRDRLLFACGWVLLGMQFAFLYPWLYWGGVGEHSGRLFLAPAAALGMITIGFSAGLYLRGSWRLSAAFLASAVAAIMVLVALRIYFSTDTLNAGQYFLLYRATHLMSGNSPVLPILLLMLAGMWWCWLGLQGIILRGKNGPSLPDASEFDNAPGLSTCMDHMRLKNLTRESQAGLMKALKPLGPDPRIYLPALFVVWLMILILGRRHPVQALDGSAYEYFYGAMFFTALFLLLTLAFRLVLVWMEFRVLLRAMEDLPLRRSFDRLKGFAWQSLWRLAGSAGSGLVNFYRLISHELESLKKFLKLEAAVAASPAEPVSYANFLENITVTEQSANTLCETLTHSVPQPRKPWERPSNYWQELLESFHAQLARTCASALIYLSAKWNAERCADAAELKVEQEKRSGAGDESKKTCEPIPCPLTACAERFVCLFFLAYILVILQRIQTLVLSTVGVFIFILMSVNSYPFEPHLRLRTLLIALFFLIIGAVGMVYAQMHRDATLSRITDTNPGELGLAFWLKMGTFILVPTLGLLAAQFPEINGFLFSWLEPAMQAVGQ
jgi:hypothetical protein